MEMPITFLQPGVPARVVDVRGGGHGLRRRLASLGILPGAEMSVVRGDTCGPMVVKIQEARFVLGRGMAHRIMVEPIG